MHALFEGSALHVHAIGATGDFRDVQSGCRLRASDMIQGHLAPMAAAMGYGGARIW